MKKDKKPYILNVLNLIYYWKSSFAKIDDSLTFFFMTENAIFCQNDGDLGCSLKFQTEFFRHPDVNFIGWSYYSFLMKVHILLLEVNASKKLKERS